MCLLANNNISKKKPWSNRKSASFWRDFLVRLKEQSLRGVKMVVSDDHAGLRKADHRLIRASVSETHENWIEAHRYLDMGLLKEQKKRMLMELAA